MAGVHAFHHRHPGILSQPLVELGASDVQRDHALRAPLEQHVREPAGRRAHVESVPAGGVHAQNLQRMVELLAAAGNEPGRLEHLERGRLVHLLPRLVEAGHPSGHHESLRLRPGLREAALHQQEVEPLSHRRAVSSVKSPASTEVSASTSSSLDRTPASVSSASAIVDSRPSSSTNPSSSSRSSTSW